LRKVYFLSTCSTSKRIIKDLRLKDRNFIFQDIKLETVSVEQLNQMYKLTGSYEVLFSKIARKYKELGLKNVDLKEDDYQEFILTEYTFLKRPVILIDDKIFVGSSKNNIRKLEEELN